MGSQEKPLTKRQRADLHKIGSSEQELIIRLHNAGESVDALAQLFGLDPTTVEGLCAGTLHVDESTDRRDLTQMSEEGHYDDQEPTSIRRYR